MKQGIIVASCKPYHIGHEELINYAAKNCDQLYVFVSTSDRTRKNEFPIMGEEMIYLWKKYIEPSMPDNTFIRYAVNPAKQAYEYIGECNMQQTEDTFVIFTARNDRNQVFTDSSLERYANDIYRKGNIHIELVNRQDTVDVSGTMMRAWLDTYAKEEFSNHLPISLKSHADEIWSNFQKSRIL